MWPEATADVLVEAVPKLNAISFLIMSLSDVPFFPLDDRICEDRDGPLFLFSTTSQMHRTVPGTLQVLNKDTTEGLE